MEPASIGERLKLAAWLKDPFAWGFIFLAGAGVIVSSLEAGGWFSSALLILVVIAASLLVLIASRKFTPVAIEIPRPSLEFLVMLGWYGLFMLYNCLTEGQGAFGNEFAKWLSFIVLPVLILYVLRGRGQNLKTLLRSIGLRRQGLGKAVLLGLLAYGSVLVVLPFIVPESQLEKLLEIFREPSRAVLMIPLSLLLSLFTAATTEEVLFRGILQSRLAVLMNSETRSCLITAFLFGIYHLPYAYFSTQWPTHGNITWAVSSVLAEQMVTGLLLGVLWSRTHNLAAPAVLHALINTAAIATSFNISFGN